MLDVVEFHDGHLIVGDCTSPEVVSTVREIGVAHCVIADPPYGNIITEKWDRVMETQEQYAAWNIEWIEQYRKCLINGGAFYLWGAYGHVNFRPYFAVLSTVERETQLEIANFIAWSKKRARGIQWGYLQTVENLAYMVNGNHKKPHAFNPPYLDKLRGYDGYNAKYPAKSPYFRRTSVWSDVTEILRGKIHPTEKPVRLAEIMIGASTNSGDLVVDPFAGSGSTAVAARNLGRRYVVVESNPEYAELIKTRLRT